ncbi:MAG TPA: N-acetylmuramoyl-L-alanine amidase [Sideroxyarcus sp.]|nr:N-acetylmuramoyl-L-alanine amidase [Sideroxyarcus sp.]
MAVWLGSPNYHTQHDIKKRFIVMHWMAGTLDSTDARFRQRASQVSAHYGVEDTRVHQYVAEKDYAFANGDTYANKYGISIEHSGGDLVGGKRRKPSPLTHETSARLCADISKRWGLGQLVVGENLYPHKHFRATQCPGSLDLRLIANRANTFLEAGPGVLEVDGVLGSRTIATLQRELGVTADGDLGPLTIRALQRVLGVPVDGLLGPVTTKALQARVGATPDGTWGAETTRRLQARLNTGRF